MKYKLLFVLVSFALLLQAQNERLALVIGNANYERGELANPVNDALLIAKTLDSLDFDVILDTNLASRSDFLKVLRDFGQRRPEYKSAFVYYAGHGIQVGAENYLLPTKEVFNSEEDVTDNGINVQKVLRYLNAISEQVNILVLDACRNNPFEQSWNGTRSIRGNGLAKMSPPTGSLIAFSTDAGSTAADGEGRNSVYCESLAENLKAENISIDQVFRNVRADVLTRTNGAQRPVEISHLIGKAVYLNDTYSNKLFFDIENKISAGLFEQADNLMRNVVGEYKNNDDYILYHFEIKLRKNEKGAIDSVMSEYINGLCNIPKKLFTPILSYTKKYQIHKEMMKEKCYDEIYNTSRFYWTDSIDKILELYPQSTGDIHSVNYSLSKRQKMALDTIEDEVINKLDENCIRDVVLMYIYMLKKDVNKFNRISRRIACLEQFDILDFEYLWYLHKEMLQDSENWREEQYLEFILNIEKNMRVCTNIYSENVYVMYEKIWMAMYYDKSLNKILAEYPSDFNFGKIGRASSISEITGIGEELLTSMNYMDSVGILTGDLELLKGYTDFLNRVAQMMEVQGGEIEEFNRVIKSNCYYLLDNSSNDDDESFALNYLAEAYYMSGDYDKMYRTQRRGLEKDSTFLYGLLGALYLKDNYSEILKYATIVQENPRLIRLIPEIASFIAEAHMVHGDYENAARCFDKAYQSGKEFAYKTAKAYFLCGDYSSSILMCEGYKDSALFQILLLNNKVAQGMLKADATIDERKKVIEPYKMFKNEQLYFYLWNNGLYNEIINITDRVWDEYDSEGGLIPMAKLLLLSRAYEMNNDFLEAFEVIVSMVEFQRVLGGDTRQLGGVDMFETKKVDLTFLKREKSRLKGIILSKME